MEAGIKDGNLRNGRTEDFPGHLNALQIHRVMEGSEGAQALDNRFDVGIYKDGLIKFSATVHDPMSHHVDGRRVFQNGRLIVPKTFQEIFNLFP